MNLFKTLLVLACLFTVAFLGAAWYFSSKVMLPNKNGCKKDHLVYCGDPSSDRGLTYETVSFKAKDGITLRGWYIPAITPTDDDSTQTEPAHAGAKKVEVADLVGEQAVVFVHGYSTDRRASLRNAKALHEAGFDVLAFDLRNHGESEGTFTSMGYYERYDVMAAVDYLKTVHGKKRVGVYGVSMGAVSSILAMAENEDIEAGLFEAPFASLEVLLTDFVKRDYGLPAFPLIDTVTTFLKIRTGLEAEAVDAMAAIKRISPRPVFVMHCDRDDYVPYEHGQMVFAAGNQPKSMWSPACVEHAEAWQAHPEETDNRVVQFFRTHLGDSALVRPSQPEGVSNTQL